jgi:putative endonuclease
MYFAYILKSEKHGRYYIGSCSDIYDRLKRHNGGRNKATKNGIPWILVYKETFLTRSEAYKREFQIKSYKGGEAFKKIVTGNGEVA